MFDAMASATTFIRTISLTLLVWVLPGCASLESGIPFLELRQARIDDDRLTVLVERYKVDAFNRVRRPSQQLATFRIASARGELEHIQTSTIASGEGVGEYLISADHDSDRKVTVCDAVGRVAAWSNSVQVNESVRTWMRDGRRNGPQSTADPTWLTLLRCLMNGPRVTGKQSRSGSPPCYCI